jgi:hypothetical protein
MPEAGVEAHMQEVEKDELNVIAAVRRAMELLRLSAGAM